MKKLTALLITLLILLTAFNIFKSNEIESKIKVMENKEREIELKETEMLNALIEGDCWITNLDHTGTGFSFPTIYCYQLKGICESSIHSLPCTWYDDDSNRSDGFCKCEFWD